MLPCICSVRAHKRLQNVERTKMWHTRRSRVCHWCSYHILTSSVIYYWTEAWQHGIDLFYIITKSLFYSKIFQDNAPAFAHFGKNETIWRNLWPIQNEAIASVIMRSKELSMVEKNHAAVKPDSSVACRGMKIYSKNRIVLRNLKILNWKCWKNQVGFCHQSSPWSRKA